jgi:hypothetical protein
MASVSDYRIEIQALSKADGGRFVGICPVACLRARRRKVLLRICAMPSPNGSNRRGRQVAPCQSQFSMLGAHSCAPLQGIEAGPVATCASSSITVLLLAARALALLQFISAFGRLQNFFRCFTNRGRVSRSYEGNNRPSVPNSSRKSVIALSRFTRMICPLPSVHLTQVLTVASER